MVRIVQITDWPQIAGIYNYYILNTTVTFEEEVISPEIMGSRVTELTKKYPWLVYELGGKVVGYAYAGPWKPRAAYKYSVEISVYVQNGLSGKGIGTALYAALLPLLKNLRIHGVIGGMALPNDSSIVLHKKFGFEQIAHFKEVGFKFGRWVDVVYYEMIL